MAGNAVIRPRRDTAANWTAANPVLALGEMGVEIGSPTKMKFGDGTTAWNALPYLTIAYTFADGSVLLAHHANIASGGLYYRKSVGAGPPEVQTLATLKADLGLANSNTGDQFTAMATGRIIGRISANAGPAEELTPAHVASLLPVATPAAKGLAPQLTDNASHFLNGKGQFAAPTGAGDPWTRDTVSAINNMTVNAYNDVIGANGAFRITPPPNSNFTIEGELLCRHAGSATQVRIQGNSTAGAGPGRYAFRIEGDVVAPASNFVDDQNSVSAATADVTANHASGGLSIIRFQVKGRSGSAPGRIDTLFRNATNGQQASILPGSEYRYRSGY